MRATPPPRCSRARLGPALLAAADVVTGTSAGAELDARAAWMRHELLDPLAARLARAGYRVAFDRTFVTWLERHLPTDGSSPEAFLDREVTPILAASLPPAPGPLTIGVQDDMPTVRPAARRGVAS